MRASFLPEINRVVRGLGRAFLYLSILYLSIRQDGAMSSWANPTVARLAIGDLTEDACGGVLICSWPMPSHVLAGYQAFAARLKAELPAEAYIYPASTPHSLSTAPSC